MMPAAISPDGVRTFTWDALNRLVKVEQGGTVVATYGYDSQNRRIRKDRGQPNHPLLILLT